MTRGTNGMVELDGARLFYESTGEGSPIVLVNPGALDCRIWEPQWRALSETHRLVRYDPRGWGRSEEASGPFSHWRDLGALMDRLGVPRAHLVGSSFGGSLVLDFAITFPGKVLSATLVGAGGPQNGFPAPEELARTFAPIAQAMKEDFARGIDVWLDTDARMPRAAEHRALVRANALENRSYWKIPPTWTEPVRPPASERLGEMRIPTLVIVGEGDHPYTHGVAKTLEKGIAGARRVVVPGAGHLVHVDRADELNRLVLDFTAEVDSMT